MKKVYVGISGGVDSAVAAFLLKEKGYEVIGYTMTLKGTPIKYDDAQMTAESLGIELLTEDVTDRFEKDIMGRFVYEYANGLTPSPCPSCNRIKFGIPNGLPGGREAYKATGHYAVVKKGGLYCSPHHKDQAYFLARLRIETIGALLLPLGFLEKKQVREIALKAGLLTASCPESQDICFLGGGDYRTFLKERGISGGSGKVLDMRGDALDEHDGFYNFTIGQRYRLGGTSERLYVVSINPADSTVIVGKEKDLYAEELSAGGINLLEKADPVSEEVYAKIRSRDSFHKVSALNMDGDRMKITFEEKVRAVTPGQLAVIYKKDGGLMRVCSSAWIEKGYRVS